VDRLLLLSAVVLLACRATPDPADADSVRVAVDTIDGVERVTSTGEAPRWSAKVLLELGSVGGAAEAEPDEFGWVSSVSLGPDGLLYVADLGRERVVAFDTTGVLRRTIGRKGQGPGEFCGVFSIAWRADTLLALDSCNARVGSFSLDGRWLGQHPALATLAASPVDFRLYRVGPREVYQWGYREVDGRLEGIWSGNDASGAPVAWPRIRGSAVMPHIAILEEEREVEIPDKVVCTMGRGVSWFEHPFAVRLVEHPAPESRVYVATSDLYRVALLDAAGDTLRIIERAVESPALTDATWSPTLARFEEWMEDKDRSQCRPRTLGRPEHMPAIESLMVDVLGRLWVERNLETGTLWEVFDETGAMVGAIEGFDHDRQRTVPWLGGEHVAWVSRGELDLPRVHLARISAGELLP
jgi:hypothetical protein